MNNDNNDSYTESDFDFDFDREEDYWMEVLDHFLAERAEYYSELFYFDDIYEE